MTHWPTRNLEEVVSFLRTQHPGEKGMARAVSERLCVTQQSISAVFKKDDASLEWVDKLAAAYGYKLRLLYPVMAMKGTVMQSRVAAMDYPNAGRLSGMVECVRMSNMTINALANQMIVSHHTVARAFQTGDIKISTLKRMAHVLGISVRWEWISLESIGHTQTQSCL